MGLIKWFNNKIRPHLILCSSSCSDEYDFPEDVLVQILCRIPADRLLLFKTVCQRWKSIISSPFFGNLNSRHLRITIDQPLNQNKNNHISIFLLTNGQGVRKNFRIYDVELGFKLAGVMRRNMRIRRIRLPETRSILQSDNDYEDLQLLGSIDGLLVFDESGYSNGRILMVIILILNPITRETRRIRYQEGHAGHVCAIFFDRFQQQHTLLHVSNKIKHSPEVYHIFNLTGTAWRRTQITYTTPSSSLASANRVPPSLHYLSSPPVIVGDTLHWLIDDEQVGPGELYKGVMALKIQSNNIHYFRHPINQSRFSSGDALSSHCFCRSRTIQSNEEKMQLIEHNGKLCFCHIGLRCDEFDLWSLEESAWVKKFKLNFPYFVGGMILSFPHKDIIAIKGTSNQIYLYHLCTNITCCSNDDISLEADNPWMVSSSYFIAFNKTLLSPNVA